jgi:type III pantothenate kinase
VPDLKLFDRWLLLRETLLHHTIDRWFALVIGNSRLHWAEFCDRQLQKTWNAPHFSGDEPQPIFAAPEDVWIASVVPQQSQFWANYASAHWIQLQDVPVQNLYPTLGIDRALALWGAIACYGGPVLVIDAGTALTFTGADGNHALVGGAILPGMRLQFEALHQGTAQLPNVAAARLMGDRWQLSTEGAILSGIGYTLAAGIQSFVEDWWCRFPGSAVVVTGGDGDRIHRQLQQSAPELSDRLTVNSDLVFLGIPALKQQFV